MPLSCATAAAQVEDPALRLRFLHSVETLTMFLGLCGDAALRANRWRRVTLALLRRPLDPQVRGVLRRLV